MSLSNPKGIGLGNRNYRYMEQPRKQESHRHCIHPAESSARIHSSTSAEVFAVWLSKCYALLCHSVTTKSFAIPLIETPSGKPTAPPSDGKLVSRVMVVCSYLPASCPTGFSQESLRRHIVVCNLGSLDKQDYQMRQTV